MFNRNKELFLFDIFVAVLKINNTVERFNNAQELLRNYNAWDSVIREFGIIGEAANNLIKSGVLDESSRVVVDFRNLLIHNYFGIDPEEVWDVVKSDLPIFKELIVEKLLKIDSELKSELIEAYIEENIFLVFIKQALELLK
ncbi:MAG: HepT-like ribonuclease domain-containing protein [Spirochaetota bacterium]